MSKQQKRGEQHQKKAKQGRKAYEKRRNSLREQRKALKNIEKNFQKQIRYLKRFVQTQDPGLLWKEREVESLADYLAEIDIVRKANGVRHQVCDTLIMILYATLCGKTDYSEIEEYLRLHEDYFTILLNLEHGTPSDTTIGRLMSEISFEELHRAFNEWSLGQLGICQEKLGDFNLHLMADGKALRALTKKHSGERHPPYMINVYAYFKKIRRGICIATIPVDKKTSESKTLVSVIAQYALPGSVVSMDAAGAYKDILEAAKARHIDVLVCIKDNQKRLVKSIENALEYAQEQRTREAFIIERSKAEYNFSQEFSDVCECLIEYPGVRHGRMESRRYKSSHSLGGFNVREWPQVKTVGCVKRLRQVVSVKNGQVIYEKEAEQTTHYYISTREMSVETFSNTIKNHWQIESRLHYVLDSEAFKEDRARMRKKNAMANMCVIRRMAYNLIELLADELPPGKSFKNKIQTIFNTNHGLESILFKKVPGLSLERKLL